MTGWRDNTAVQVVAWAFVAGLALAAAAVPLFALTLFVEWMGGK
jgi:hypothetical protein